MFVCRALLILAPFICFNCYSRRVPVKDVMWNKNVMQLINSYIKPLSEKFPNHEFEIQVDIQGPPLHHIGRRKAHSRKPNNIRILRAGDTSQLSQNAKPQPTVKSATTQPPTFPLATKPSPTPPTTARVEKFTPKKEPTKEPVYKDDLQKALDDLEKKINKNFSKGSGGDPELRDQIVISNPGPVTGGSNQNINRIIELMRKGVHFQRHVPNTDDGNLEWMQIKIPKSLSDNMTR